MINLTVKRSTNNGFDEQNKIRSKEVIALLILCYITLVIGATINGVLLVVFARSKRLRYLPTNKLICSLLTSDFLIEVGLTLTISVQANSLVHTISYVLKVFALTVTVLNLCLIWVDRLITVKLTFSHQRIIDNKTVIKLIIMSWSLGIALAIVSTVMLVLRIDEIVFLKWRYVLSIITLIGFLVLTIANIIIYCVARGQIHKIKRQSSGRSGNFRYWQLKSTYLCTAMVASFLITWLPYLIENIAVLLQGACHPSFSEYWFELFSSLMIICNTIAHPCLYVLLNRDIRTLMARRWRNSMTNFSLQRPIDSQRRGSSIFVLSIKTTEFTK